MKLMSKLIAGDMGIEVKYAMQPQYELRRDVGDIAVDLIEKYETDSALAEWGWNCMIAGTPQAVPPVSLLVGPRFFDQPDPEVPLEH
ncbi:hypothetical protein [Pseudomonas sp. SDO55104_S430]